MGNLQVKLTYASVFACRKLTRPHFVLCVKYFSCSPVAFLSPQLINWMTSVLFVLLLFYYCRMHVVNWLPFCSVAIHYNQCSDVCTKSLLRTGSSRKPTWLSRHWQFCPWEPVSAYSRTSDGVMLRLDFNKWLCFPERTPQIAPESPMAMLW